MKYLPELFANNRRWVADQKQRDPLLFERLSTGQQPQYVWIGCSDSRIPQNEVVGLPPGELFVHRNIANLVRPEDANCMSVVQYAVDVLQAHHIIVCGHYGCGGVAAAAQGGTSGHIDGWLEPLRVLRKKHADELASLDATAAVRRLAELNVMEQVRLLCATDVISSAWSAGQQLVVHGWIFDIATGLLADLGVSRSGSQTE